MPKLKSNPNSIPSINYVNNIYSNAIKTSGINHYHPNRIVMCLKKIVTNQFDC